MNYYTAFMGFIIGANLLCIFAFPSSVLPIVCFPWWALQLTVILAMKNHSDAMLREAFVYGVKPCA